MNRCKTMHGTVDLALMLYTFTLGACAWLEINWGKAARTVISLTWDWRAIIRLGFSARAGRIEGVNQSYIGFNVDILCLSFDFDVSINTALPVPSELIDREQEQLDGQEEPASFIDTAKMTCMFCACEDDGVLCDIHAERAAVMELDYADQISVRSWYSIQEAASLARQEVLLDGAP